tara:strand:- start:5436 stop:5876 length:441 start_codon:yes stop_codon:yes gene_type:complete
MKNKRGLSPVIATVLLISLALILALIIFLWAKSFVAESITKFDDPIEFKCDEINFEAEVVSGEGLVHVVNKGNIPISGVEVKSVGAGSIKDLGVGDGSIRSGETASYVVDVGGSDKLQVAPVILGETNEYKKQYVCENSAIEVIVI